jgi:hypothetical protein
MATTSTLSPARAQVMPAHDGIPWLGFVVYPNHRLLKQRNTVHFRQRSTGVAKDMRHLAKPFEPSARTEEW